MLSAKYLAGLPDNLVRLYAQAEQDILVDMAGRIGAMNFYIPAAQWQHQKLQELGLTTKEIQKRLSAITGKTEDEIRQIMYDSAAESLANDSLVNRTATGEITLSKAAQAVMNAGIARTNSLFQNLTKTAVKLGTRQFEEACDRAYLQVSTGAFSRDAAVKMAVKDLTNQGLNAVTYESGRVDSVDVAVRRAVGTGVNQTAIQVSLTEGEEMGCELMELTAHEGARPSHAAWQGRIVRVRGDPEQGEPYLTLSDIGYGTGAGFGGWNCRHSWGPYWPGDPLAYSDELLGKYNEKSITYNGQKMTEYDASQVQRGIERNIRKYKREYAAMDAAGLPTDEAAAKLSEWQAREKDFLSQTGLKKQTDRTQISGFGRSEAAKVSAQANLPETVRRFNTRHIALTDDEKLPAYKSAEIPVEKLSGYALNKNHPTGKHKAVAFEEALGYTVDNQDELIQQVHAGLAKYKATKRQTTQYGQTFEVQMMIRGANGKYAKVKTGWIIDVGKEIPRLTSIYVAD